MNFNEFEAGLKIEGTGSVVVNGLTITAEELKQTIKMRIWKSAQVIKNRREQDKGGLKLTVSSALSAKLITEGEALQIILSNDKAKAQALAEKLPKTEKTEDPSADDIAMAVRLVASGKGQSA
jgi:hypothetical protein